MTYSHRRHDISDEVWAQLETHLPGRRGVWGGRARDNRQFINAVFWIMRTSAPWRIYRRIMAIGTIRIATVQIRCIALWANIS